MLLWQYNNNNNDNNNNNSNNNNNNKNNNNNDVKIKFSKSKYFLLPALSWKQMGLPKKKEKKRNVFYFFIKIPNLNVYWNQNGKSMFPICIDHFGHQKRETKQQQINKQRSKKIQRKNK